MKRIKTKKNQMLPRVTLIMVTGILICILLGMRQLKNYEAGIIEVCAAQQDAYVQLVLDQINLKDNRDDEEIITNILGTLDSSSEKYWTFAKNQSMLFVKDVTETYRYKGVTAATYYASNSAGKFIDSLSVNKVRHDNIEIDGKSYIVSGVAFSYRGENYRLCLLTNREVLLDNNAFLGSKAEIILVICLILSLSLLVTLWVAHRADDLMKEKEQMYQTIEELNHTILRVQSDLKDKELLDTSANLWSKNALPNFVERLIQRGMKQATLGVAKCDATSGRDKLLKIVKEGVLEANVCFAKNDKDLIFLFFDADADRIREEFKLRCASLQGDGVHVEKIEILTLNEMALKNLEAIYDI